MLSNINWFTPLIQVSGELDMTYNSFIQLMGKNSTALRELS